LAEPKRRTPLTRREQGVVKLVIEGLTNRQVGQQLSLAEQTVANNPFRIYEKLAISNRVELVL
jgi:DNA-binding NarL/FixJ family response regulator